MAMKENDWILDGIVNPDKSLDDFIIAGYNTNNTQLLSKDAYKNNTIVQQAFTENGAFNQVKFDEFYKNRSTSYGKMQQMDAIDSFQYSPFDVEAPKNAYYKSPEFNLIRISNPLRDKSSLTGALYSSGLSQREIAQQNKIYDSTTNSFSDDRLIDRALSVSPIKWIKDLFADPIIYATYDDDGTHIDQITGEKIQHHKGEYKLNAYGEPYTEKLNGRSLIGKEVVSVFDNLTVDGEGIDKYNFLDSDGIDKSTTGTIMKGVAALSPLLVPGFGEYYAYGMVVKELLKTLPMLYGMVAPWVGLPDEQPILNTIAGIGKKYSSSMADAATQSVFNKEQFVNLITDVALQWGQQQGVSKLIQKLKGTDKLMEDATSKAFINYTLSRQSAEQMLNSGEMTEKYFARMFGDASKWSESIFGKSALEATTKGVEELVQKSRRLGADASLVYMALVSNTDVYDTMKQAGATAKEASAVTLGATLGMFGVDKYLHLGELFFDDLTTPTIKQIQRTQKKAVQSFIDNGLLDKKLIDGVAEQNVHRIKRFMKAGLNIGRKGISNYAESLKYHTTGFFGKALGEGIEETAEELVTDMTKGLYELAGSLGMDTGAKDVGAWDNMLERYGMSFLGGFLGGGIYYGKDILQNGKFQIDTTQDDYIYLIRNGKTKQALDALEEAYKKGNLASTDLSMQTTTDQNGNKVYLTADDNNPSQNDFVYNKIKDAILQLDSIVGSVDGKKNDDELMEQCFLKESRFRDLQDYLHLKNFTYLAGYQQEYQKLLNNIADLQGMYDRASQTKTGLAYSSEKEFENNKMTDLEKRNLSEQQVSERNKNLNNILDQLNSAKEELRKYNSGEYSLEYIDKILFAMDESVNSDFVQLNYESWLRQNHDGKTPEELTDSEKIQYKKEYLDYKKAQQKEDLEKSYQLYKEISKLTNPALKEVQNNSSLFHNQKQLLDEISKLDYKQYGWDSVLDFNGETEESEEYKNRNDAATRNERADKILQENNRISKEFYEKLNSIIKKYGDYIDPVTKRNLKLALINRKQDFVNQHLEELKQSLYNTAYNEKGEVVQNNVLSDADEYFLNLIQKFNNDNDAQKVIDNLKKYLIESEFKRNNRVAYILQTVTDSFGKIGNPNSLSNNIMSIGFEESDVDELFNLYKGLDNDESNALTDYILSHTTKNAIEKEINNSGSELNNLFNIYYQRFNEYSRAISNDYNIKIFDLLEQKIKNTGIVNQLIKKIAGKLNTNVDIESTLDYLDKILDSAESRDDFIIPGATIEDMQEVQKILKLVQSYVFASAKIPNFLSPEGHNSVLNETAKKHSDIFKDYEELPELDQDVANSILSTLEQYIQQIGVEDPKTGTYNQNSYLYISSINSVNKALAHKKTDKALNTALVKLLKHRESFQFEFNGQTYDLLEGAEAITEDTELPYITFNKYATILYNNVQKLIKDGWTYKDIFERSQILEKISAFDKNPDLFIQQTTAPIDQKLTYDRMTSYDKVVNLLTIMSIDPSKYNVYLQERIENENNKAPLTAQEWISRVGIALVNNVEIFNSATDYISQKIQIDKAVFRNTIFINANQGAGKTSVCAKNIALWNPKSVIWISTPKENQLQTLFESIGNGVRMVNRESITVDSKESPSLISRIIKNVKNYNLVMDYINKKAEDAPSCISVLENEENIYYKIDYDKLGIEKDSNAPAVIIIDEATHLSSFELQCIAHYCNVNNTRLVLMGDNKQNGFIGRGGNLRPSGAFLWRSQNLNISLRDNNIQHNQNLTVVESLLDKCLVTADKDVLNVEKIFAAIKSLNFKYCLQNGINGDVVSNSLTDDLVSELSGKIGYIGKETDAEYKQLTNANLDVKAMDPIDVQGQEFDYVVINKKYSLPANATLFDNFQLLQDIYTMMSRGRNGSVFIDSTNMLENLIGENTVETITSKSGSILGYAKQFQDEKLDMLKKINNNEKTETQNPAPTPGPSNSKPPQPKGSNSEPPKQVKISIPYGREDGNPVQIVEYKDFINDPEITIDADFNDKYYLLYSVVNQDTVNTDNDGTTKIDNIKKASKLQVINSAIEKLNPGQSLAIIIVPKIEGLPKNISGEQVFNEMQKSGIDIENLPNKYIYKIVQNNSVQQNIDETIPNPVEKPKEIQPEESVNDDFEIINMNAPGNMLAYGKVSFTGLFKTYDNSGMEIWENHHVAGESKRDMELFTNDGETLNANDQSQIELSNTIKGFKNGILYKTEYKNLPEKVKQVISEDEYNKMQYRISVRRKTEKDNFIRNIGISEDRSTIGDYLYAIEGVFKTKDGQTGIITIGLMSNPETWIANASKNQNKYTEKVKELQSKYDNVLNKKYKDKLKKQIDYYEQLIKDNDTNNPESKINKYKAFIDRLKNSLEKSNSDSVHINVDLHTSGMTDIHKTGKWHRITRITNATIKSIEAYISTLENELQNPKISVYKKTQIEGMIERAKIKIESLREIKENSFSSLNPYTTIGSQMVVYTGNSLDISDHNQGRYVAMLVSNDPSLSNDELIQEYLKQKLDQKDDRGETTPRVRLIPLNPVGVSFQDLNSTYMREALSSTLSTKNGTINQPFPFKTHYMGVRMFTAMWNFRANLNQFLNELNKFIDNLKANDLIQNSEDLDKCLLLQDLEYKLKTNQALSEFETTYYQQNINTNNYSEIIKAVNEFNSRLTNDLQIKRFRLGGGLKNGAYIRKIDGAQNLYSVSDDKTIFGIYGTVLTFNNYKDAIDSVFQNIIDPIIKCDYDQNKVLSNNTGVINSFANHISSILTNGGYTECNGEKITFQNNTGIDIPSIGNVFSHLPMVLSKAYRNIISHIEETNDQKLVSNDKIIIKTSTSSNSAEINWENVLNDIGGRTISTQQFVTNPIDSFDSVLNAKRFEDLFSLMFHGTIGDFHDPNMIKDSLAQFPNGFYADPLTTGNQITAPDGSTIFKEVAYQPYFWETDVSIGDPTFFVSEKSSSGNTAPVNQTAQIDNNAILENVLNSDKYKDIPINAKNDIRNRLQQILEDNTDEQLTENDLEEQIDQILMDYNNNYQNLVTFINNKNLNLDSFIMVDNQVQTFRDFLSNLIKLNNNRNIQMVSYDTQTKIVTITDNENSKYQISQDLNSGLWNLISNEKIDTNNTSSLDDLVQNAYDQIDQNEDLDDDEKDTIKEEGIDKIKDIIERNRDNDKISDKDLDAVLNVLNYIRNSGINVDTNSPIQILIDQLKIRPC